MFTTKITPSNHVENPRESFDCSGKMFCFHKKYDLGDKHDKKNEDFAGWNDMRAALEKEFDVVIPLYLLDHSGLTMSTTPFSCNFDSGQVGFICATATEKSELTKQTLLSEVKIYSMYLEGDVWDVSILDENQNVVESLCEVYGYDFAETESKDLLKYLESESV